MPALLAMASAVRRLSPLSHARRFRTEGVRYRKHPHEAPVHGKQEGRRAGIRQFRQTGIQILYRVKRDLPLFHQSLVTEQQRYGLVFQIYVAEYAEAGNAGKVADGIQVEIPLLGGGRHGQRERMLGHALKRGGVP